MRKRVLATWFVGTKSNFTAHCLITSKYGFIDPDYDNSGKKLGEVIDFGSGGWWPLKDFVYITKNKCHECCDYVNFIPRIHRNFALENGIYVHFLQTVKPKSKV